jgi:uncharacterized alpha-E superfamily protein
MLSRVANSLFWLARYLERAENCARFLLVTQGYAQELRAVSHEAAEECWRVAHGLFHAPHPAPGSGAAVRALIFAEESPSSLIACVLRARENARGIRDALASEIWEELNVLYLRMREEAETPGFEPGDVPLLQRLIRASQLIQGVRDATMQRADEWHFLYLGQQLERASVLAAILDVMYGHRAIQDAAAAGQSIETLHLAATLRACTAQEAFRRSGRPLTAARVAEFLLLDGTFPRSVESCVREVGLALHALSGTPPDLFSSEAEQLAGRLLAELRFARIEEIMAKGVHETLEDTNEKLARIGTAIHALYFP